MYGNKNTWIANEEYYRKAYEVIEQARLKMLEASNYYEHSCKYPNGRDSNDQITDDINLLTDILSSKVNAVVDNKGTLSITINGVFPSLKKYDEREDYYQELWVKYIAIALAKIKDSGKEIPYYDKAMLIIDIHMPPTPPDLWPVNNKAYKIIVNALRFKVFGRDDCNKFAFSVYGNYDKDIHVKIMVFEYEKFQDFLTSMGLPFLR